LKSSKISNSIETPGKCGDLLEFEILSGNLEFNWFYWKFLARLMEGRPLAKFSSVSVTVKLATPV